MGCNEVYNYRLHTFNYHFAIYSADLNNLESLTKEKFNSELCQLIPQKNYIMVTRYRIIVFVYEENHT